MGKREKFWILDVGLERDIERTVPEACEAGDLDFGLDGFVF
jgi:hypothetical protein